MKKRHLQHRTFSAQCESLEPRMVLSGGPLITELMAVNTDTLEANSATLTRWVESTGWVPETEWELDHGVPEAWVPSGEFPDWIEIYNPTDDPIDLGEWYLTDRSDDLTKWQFPSAEKAPSVVIDPGEYQIVFMSGDTVSYDDALRIRDFHKVRDATFLADLPDGDYDITVTMGDALWETESVALWVQGEKLEEGIFTATNEFRTFTFRASVSAATNGQMAVRLVDSSGDTGTRRGVINALEIVEVSPGIGTPPMRFDFGAVDSPVDPDYLQVAPEDTYTAESGYGWNRLHAGARDRGVPDLHADFKLSSGGEFLALVDPAQTIVHQYAPEFPPQEGFISYGLDADLVTPLYFAVPTPGAPNGQGALGFVNPPTISVDGGFFDAPLDVEITTDEPGVVGIRYTTNGSIPTPTTGMLYEGPIHVDHTTTLRAIAVRPGYQSIHAATRSYLFLEDVLTQPDDPEGYPQLWGGGDVQSDYGIRPEVVDLHRDTILDDLKAVPTLSLVLDIDDMFGLGGTYVSGGNVDNPVSAELLYPDGRDGFQIDAGLRLSGASNRGAAGQNSLRLKFSPTWGPSQLDFPVFEDSPVTQFDSLVLRAGTQDGWRSSKTQLIRDEYSRRTQLAMDRPSAHGTFMHLYINGLYWGLYNVTERPDASFASEHMGGDEEDWDAFNAGRLRDGDRDAWEEMLALTPLGSRDPDYDFSEENINAKYEEIQQYLDIEGFIDYILIGVYMSTEDWLPNNNWEARRSRDGDGPVAPDDPAGVFRFFHWDQEVSLQGLDSFRGFPGSISPIGRIYQFLRLSEEFRELQAERVNARLVNDGPLSPQVAANRYLGLMDEIADAVRGENVRWAGNTCIAPIAPTGCEDDGWIVNTTKVDSWRDTGEGLIEDYFPYRWEGIVTQYRDAGLYSDVVFSRQGGRVFATDTLSMTGTEGVIYYTTDGSDPRLEDGSVSSAAVVYDSPLSITDGMVANARSMTDGQWSLMNHAEYVLVEAGDMNLDGIVDMDDITSFTSALTDSFSYLRQEGVWATERGDIDRNGQFDFDDIAPFVARLNGSIPVGVTAVAAVEDGDVTGATSVRPETRRPNTHAVLPVSARFQPVTDVDRDDAAGTRSGSQGVDAFFSEMDSGLHHRRIARKPGRPDRFDRAADDRRQEPTWHDAVDRLMTNWWHRLSEGPSRGNVPS